MSKSARRRFWFLTLLAAGVIALFCRLALWQYHRAHEREIRIAAARAAVSSPATRLGAAPAESPLFAHVYADGRYDGRHQILLQERPQPHGQAVGVEILTPLRLASGATLLVNRGWVPADAEGRTRADLTPPAGRVRVSGYLAGLTRPGLRLPPSATHSKTWPRRLLYPGWKTLGKLYGRPLIRRILLLGPNAAGGYARDWRLKPEHGPAENYGYMAQWLGLAATVLVVWVLLTLRARRRRSAS